MRRTWTIIGVGDVPGSFEWYQSLLGLPETTPAHDDFGQILEIQQADPEVPLRIGEYQRAAVVSARYVAAYDMSRRRGVPRSGREPSRFWISPTNTTSFVGSIQNHVPKAPPQKNEPTPCGVPAAFGSMTIAKSIPKPMPFCVGP